MAEMRPRKGEGARSCTIVLASPKFEESPIARTTIAIALTRKLWERDIAKECYRHQQNRDDHETEALVTRHTQEAKRAEERTNAGNGHQVTHRDRTKMKNVAHIERHHHAKGTEKQRW